MTGKPYEWVRDPRTGMFWQRPTGLSALTSEQRRALFNPMENARAAMRHWNSRRRCERCGRYLHRRAVRYFGGLRYTWVCSWCDRKRHG